jgi:predicted MFS family arabinose efflux permease
MHTALDVSSPGTNELKTVLVLALGFGLVGIDRFLISTLFPVIAHDLHLGYGDIGTITGVLAIAWGVAALWMGNLADHIGRRRILVGSLLAFSLLIGASGLATGLGGLVLVRIVMGLADGAYTPASISATLEASPPRRRGRNIGIQQMMLTLCGLGLAPVLVSVLLRAINWRWIFCVFLLPGLLLAWATWRVVPDNSHGRAMRQHNPLADWRAVLSYSNIRILMLGMLCWLTCLITTSALLPSYLLDHVRLSFGAMSTVMSAIGLGAACGTLLLPWWSDRAGRRLVMILGTVGAGVSLALLAWIKTPTVGALFFGVFAVHFFNNSLITLTVGPLCSESVPPALGATASGVVIGVGELFGGGVAPVAAGQVAERFGIEHLLWLPIGAMAVGFVACFFLEETRLTPGLQLRRHSLTPRSLEPRSF